jgi:4-carboxymuconolactone decarboxylase
MIPAMAALTPPNPRHPLPDTKKTDRPKGLNCMGVLARYPALVHAFHVFNGHVQFATTLSVQQRELVVLRVAVLRRSDYEWAQHCVAADDVGLSVEAMARVPAGPDAAGWSPSEQAMLRALDELIADATLTDATWDALGEHFDEHQILDLIFTVGAYETVAMVFNATGVRIEEDLRKRYSQLRD